MKILSNKQFLITLMMPLMLLTSCDKDDPISPEEPDGTAIFASGLMAPQGIEVDGLGRLWVAEQGTGSNDGVISMIDSEGTRHPFVTNIPSSTQEGMAGSAHHLLVDGQTLWAALGVTSEVSTSQLLKFDFNDFEAGDPPIEMNNGHIVADISALVLSYPFQNQTNESNVYNLALGPANKILLVDAAANAVIEFDKSSQALKVLAELPTTVNASGQGPPRVDAVPTGITFHNGQIYVSAFGGFPFTPGTSKIYQVDMNGSVTLHFDGLNGAVDLLLDGSDLIVVEFATFQGGFQANSSRILRINGNQLQVIEENLHFINAACIGAGRELYFSSIQTGEILRSPLP